MMFDIVDVKDSNTEIFIKYHINDTTTISNNFTKFSFEFKNFLKKRARRKHTRKNKKNLKKNENESFEKMKKKKTDE